MQEDPVYRSSRCLVGVGVGCGMIGREAGWTLECVFVLSYVRGLLCLLGGLSALVSRGVSTAVERNGSGVTLSSCGEVEGVSVIDGF